MRTESLARLEYELQIRADERGIEIYRDSGKKRCYFYHLSAQGLEGLPDDFNNTPVGPYPTSLAALRAALEV